MLSLNWKEARMKLRIESRIRVREEEKQGKYINSGVLTEKSSFNQSLKTPEPQRTPDIYFSDWIKAVQIW